ncbi:peptidoglycan D,D-transpeptidase FtsI family protein [Aquifex sp.]
MEHLIRYREREKAFKSRLIIFLLFILFIPLIFFGRLIYINFFKEEILEEFGKNAEILKVQIFRGSILDRKGIPLAISYPVGYIYLYKFYLFKDKEKEERFLKKLSKELNIPYRRLKIKLDKLRNKKVTEFIKFPVEKRYIVEKIIKEVDYSKKDKKFTKPYISAHVGVSERYERYYPHRRFASNLIGFVNKEGEGGEGLEYQFNKYLTGNGKGNVKLIVYNDRGLKLVELKENSFAPPENLKLSIDYTVQTFIERLKRKIVRRWHPKKVVIIVMESETGKVRGFTTYPDYDPNNYVKYFPKYTKNFGVNDLFEVGSTFKPFVITYALERGYIKRNSLIEIDYGVFKLDKKVIRDISLYLRSRKYIKPDDILIYSSNVGAMKVGLMLSPKEFSNLLEIFRLKKTPGILIGETNPKINPLSNDVNRAYASIGQGLAFNALHFLSSFNTLILGKYVKPSILEDEETKVEPTNISERTVMWIRNALIRVVEEGTGKRARSAYFYIGGKTGTAQKYDKKLRRYSKKKVTTFFVGFFPKEPKFTAIILVDEPRGKELFGGTVAAPYFKELAERVATIYGLKPDKI